MESPKRLLAIVGATASGKSAMAMTLAQKYHGEIVCADSRTIYKGMDIGTAKPSLSDQALVRHHCIDLVEPNEVYSVADFQTAAKQAIAEIRRSGNLPIIVGGSGLYLDAVLYNFTFEEMAEYPLLRDLSLEKLQEIANERGLRPTPETYTNARHLAGYIARGGMSNKEPLPDTTILIGIDVEKAELVERITQRVEHMVQSGLVGEVEQLIKRYGLTAPGFETPGYKPIVQYILGEISLDEAKDQFIQRDTRLAKRQLTWFKRNKDIHWVRTLAQAEQIINERR